jgi:hypothetical protein
VTPDRWAGIAALLAALVLPVAALRRRRLAMRAPWKLALLWTLIIGLAWLAASAAPYIRRYFT